MNGLTETLQRFADAAKQRPLTIGEALDTLDEAAFALIAIILILPFLQPVPLGPISVIGGLTLAALGCQLLTGRDVPALPQRVRDTALNEKTWRIMVTASLKLIRFCRLFTRPRMRHLVNGRLGRLICGTILLAGGLLMAIPFPIPLPLNNVLPGLAMLFYCIGELEDDGLMVFVAVFLLIVTVAYFTAFFVALWLLGSEAVSYFSLR
ncbi:MAG TPA: exopolysaccharide biosynthesis protein [Methylophilaceae bacterium]